MHEFRLPNTQLSYSACAPRGHSAPITPPGRQKWGGGGLHKGGNQLAQQQQQQQPFCYSLSAQAPQCKWGEGGGGWFGEAWLDADNGSESAEMCVCVMQKEGEKMSSRGISPSINSQLSHRFEHTHASLSLIHSPAQAGGRGPCWQGVCHELLVLAGIKENPQIYSLSEAGWLERQ